MVESYSCLISSLLKIYKELVMKRINKNRLEKSKERRGELLVDSDEDYDVFLI